MEISYNALLSLGNSQIQKTPNYHVAFRFFFVGSTYRNLISFEATHGFKEFGRIQLE